MSDIEVPNEILHLRDILSLALKFPQSDSGPKSPFGHEIIAPGCLQSAPG
jgi:hypothetical protein